MRPTSPFEQEILGNGGFLPKPQDLTMFFFQQQLYISEAYSSLAFVILINSLPSFAHFQTNLISDSQATLFTSAYKTALAFNLVIRARNSLHRRGTVSSSRFEKKKTNHIQMYTITFIAPRANHFFLRRYIILSYNKKGHGIYIKCRQYSE